MIPEPKASCLMCERIAAFSEDKENPFVIHEFKHSFFVVGDHQFYRGYSQLLFKKHVRELHELPAQIQLELFAELMVAAQAIAATFEPWKMNYSCYGNVVPHIHWHLFPRYADDPDRLEVPWFHAADFSKHLTDAETAAATAEKIRSNLILPQISQ